MSTANFTRIKHDANGNPRHVTSWLGFGFNSYAEAIRAANTIGGSKYNTRAFGGGIMFQSYECELAEINRRMIEIGACHD